MITIYCNNKVHYRRDDPHDPVVQESQEEPRRSHWFLRWAPVKALLAVLLHYANTDPFGDKVAFYQIKDRLLRDYGTPDGTDIQHIVKPCYQCDGSGVYKGDYVDQGDRVIWVSATPEPCRKCGGSGKYEEFWVLLERWQFGRYPFHLPVKRVYVESELNGIHAKHRIEDYIEHQRPKYYLAKEALWWLLLFFDTRYFLEHFGHVDYCARKFTPMVVLSSWLMWFRDMRRKWQCRGRDDEIPF